MAEAKKEACWYVIHTYSGYENKVKDTLEKSVENNGMQDLILEVRVPMEEVVEIRNGKRVKSTRKVYPGYVLVHMIETSVFFCKFLSWIRTEPPPTSVPLSTIS